MSGAGMTELSGYRCVQEWIMVTISCHSFPFSEESSTDLCMQYDKIEEFGNCNKF